jgi:hypothetical protein
MTPPDLPYDVLLHIFKEVVILRSDFLDGFTASWLLSSTSVDLLSCALVARSWRLPAQQSLWRAIDLSELALKPFLRTAACRPDLARQVQVFAVAYRLGLNHRLALTKEEKLLTSTFLPALAGCPNVRILRSDISDEQPGFEAVITTLQLSRPGVEAGHCKRWSSLLAPRQPFVVLKSGFSKNDGRPNLLAPSPLRRPSPPSASGARSPPSTYSLSKP